MAQKRKIVNDPLTDSRGEDSVLILDGGLIALPFVLKKSSLQDEMLSHLELVRLHTLIPCLSSSIRSEKKPTGGLATHIESYLGREKRSKTVLICFEVHAFLLKSQLVASYADFCFVL